MNKDYVSLSVQVQPAEISRLKLMIVLDNNLPGESFMDVHKKKERSSNPDVLCKKGILNFSKLTGKHLLQSIFFSKVEHPSKKRVWHRCFTVNFCKVFKNNFFIEQLRWLDLNVFPIKRKIQKIFWPNSFLNSDFLVKMSPSKMEKTSFCSQTKYIQKIKKIAGNIYYVG